MSGEGTEEFWDRMADVEIDEDTATRLILLVARMFDGDVVRRDGDKLIGRGGDEITLDRDEQWLVRVIEEAVAS